ncbi:MAG TPA: DNA polymerase I, partial [Clostridiales bacterium]|nr:DNA polymerase I [Clostridiales bacterium]
MVYKKMDNKKLMLIDGNSILNRAFYGLKGSQLLATSYGLYTNAVYGFLNILFKYQDEEQPQYICVAFDMKAPTFRHDQYEGYKANRKGMPDELAVQMPVLKDVLDAMNITRVEYSGYEADDLIGWLSRCGEDKGMDVVIVTGDRDSLQLISEKTRIKLPSTRFGKTNTEEYNLSSFYEKYSISPTQFIDVKGLMGDPSDNIPGVRGIGEKTALELIRNFGSIEEIYNNINKVDKKGVREKLETGRDMAFLSRQLATIERKVPEELCQIDNLKIRGYDTERLYQLFKKLEFKSLIEKLGLHSVDSKNKDTGITYMEKAGENSNDENSQGENSQVSNNDQQNNLKRIIYIKNAGDLAELRSRLLSCNEIGISHILEKTPEKGELVGELAAFALSWKESSRIYSAYVELTEDINEENFIDEFKDIFLDESVKKIGHNIKNLLLYLKCRDISLKGLAFDTMIAAYILNPSRNTYMVSELTADYLKKEIEHLEELTGKGKNQICYREVPCNHLARAATGYSEAILELKQVLEKEIRSNQQEMLYYQIELPLVEVLASMEYYGFKINKDELSTFSVELDEKIGTLTSEIYSLAGEEFNINSTKQLGAILFDKLGLPVIKKTKTGYSTDAEVLEQLASMHSIVSSILEYRQLMKLKSTYVDGLLSVINERTDKIHTSFNQTVVVTGRISSTEPNLQNIPYKLEMGRKIRKVFVPSSKEYILTDADYAQIELRVLAHISGDKSRISAF